MNKTKLEFTDDELDTLDVALDYLIFHTKKHRDDCKDNKELYDDFDDDLNDFYNLQKRIRGEDVIK